MWSLPDIIALNERAAKNAGALRRKARNGPHGVCEAFGCENPATESRLWFDIFSDDPKGSDSYCEQHEHLFDEDVFTCADCGRRTVTNYTWEVYSVVLDGEVVCLRCAAKRYFSDPRNWIHPSKVKDVVLDPKRGGDVFDEKTGLLNLAKCRHVLGVRQPIPAGIVFHDNAEFDNLDGHQISGAPPAEIVRTIGKPFCPVLDAGYQFAVSIGFYTKKPRKGGSCVRR